MSMSRKDYNKIADAIFNEFKEGETYYKFEIAQIIAIALKGTNTRFDSMKFYRACMHNCNVSTKSKRRTIKESVPRVSPRS